MRDNNQHILFVATEYEAGMRSYASAIIHALWQKGDQVLIVIKREDYKRDFDDIPATCMTWISYPTSKIGKAKFRFRPSSVIHAIENLGGVIMIRIMCCRMHYTRAESAMAFDCTNMRLVDVRC